MDTILNDAMVSILSLLAGVLATVAIARYYFLRTVEKSKKSLVPYVDFFSEVLVGIDPEVRKALSISYQNLEVEDLVEVQFLVANSGEKPIRDVIKPLALTIPDSSKIMNVVLLHISPEGRVVTLDVDKKTNTVKFLFDLLNKDEFFVFKLLLNGKADIKEFKFTITVDDLPPVLKTKSLPYDLVEIEDADKSSDIEWGLLLAGLVFIILGVPVGYLALDVSATLPDFADKSVFSYISEVPLIWIAKWPTVIVGILILLVGNGMMIGSVSGASLFNKKKKLILPKGIIRSGSFLFREFRLEAKMNREAANDDNEKS
ncbi:hypothetical protein KA005_59145 [bacterium]|nr:hypothetical protein [bacterium]